MSLLTQGELELAHSVTFFYAGANADKTDRPLLRNTEVRSCNHCCKAKVLSSVCVCVCVCVCSLWYPACNAHVLYCHVWPAQLYDIFPHIISYAVRLSKKNVMEREVCVLILSETFLILRRIEGDRSNLCICP